MSIVLVFLVIGVVLALFLLASVGTFVRKHGALTLIWRFALGHHLDGKDRTNASYLQWGDKVLHHRGRASKWAHRPLLHRAGIRWVVVLTSSGMTYGFLADEMLTVVSLVSVAVLSIVLNERRIQRKIQGRFVARYTVRPMLDAVAGQLGIASVTLENSISLRPDYAKSKGLETIGQMVLPDSYAANPAQREMMEHLITSRLGIEVSYTWHTSKHPMTLEIKRAPIAPTMVRFNDMLPTIKKMPKDEVLLGVTGSYVNKTWDMGSEDPHMLVSANTRRGKTRLLLLIACQVLGQGAENVTIIDPKAVGVDECLAGIPGVVIKNDPRNIEDMWKGIRDFRKLMDSRVDAFKQDRTLEFDRALLVIDELSQFTAMSKVYWSEIKENKDKSTPPIFNDLAAILWQGAQFKCSVLVFGQRVEASTLAGLIDSFGTRLLAGFTKRTYERLVAIPPVPKSSRHRGRFIYFDGESPVSIQTVLGNDQELRELALSGKPIARKAIQITGEVISSVNEAAVPNKIDTEKR